MGMVSGLPAANHSVYRAVTMSLLQRSLPLGYCHTSVGLVILSIVDQCTGAAAGLRDWEAALCGTGHILGSSARSRTSCAVLQVRLWLQVVAPRLRLVEFGADFLLTF